ncbi:glycosyltransferase family 25 protein [Aureimonas fodinaquatilis]|uniref:Glycosyltransferase family 25 protein n=1 Tax=Aureimonas fodinaquatilis TaxID=2565783 RepID=A0A5B0DY99_9HYPH|nr:glycosyltransferase family 25 protein [Aureimonas fodinaquatilis]KAA0971797.1 glycosyltransferase family 25 protein [Aureimonas fodinaquatilis]
MIRSVFINLDSAVERRAYMEEQGRKIGLPLERLPAVKADTIAPSLMQGLGQSWERPLTPSELACFLSHRAAWWQVLAENRPMLVLEDDAVLSSELPAAIAAAENLSGIDFLNFEDFDRRRFVRRGGAMPLMPGVSLVSSARDKAGSAAYMLWPSGARKLLALSERRAAPADAFLHAEARLASRISEPALAAQMHVLAARGQDFGAHAASSIQAVRHKLPFSRKNLHFFRRRLMTQLRLAPYHLGRLGPLSYRKILFQPSAAPAKTS